MKTTVKITAGLLLATLFVQPATLHAQGALTPPGPPAAIMKTLDQIEARTPISSLPYTIANGGSYYLTGNLTTGASNGIVVAASGVTLDLNGYTIYSSVALAQNGGTAILLDGSITDVTIQNGHIFSGVVHTGFGYFGSGFGFGIYGGAADITVRNVSISGCQFTGILLSVDSTLVESCQVQTVGNDGIDASMVKNSSALDCGTEGIDCRQVFDSRGESTGTGNGISATFSAANCYGVSGTYTGISAENALNCRGSSSSYVGLSADTAENCEGLSNSNVGLSAETAANCEGVSYGSGSYGLVAYYSAQNCYGRTSGNGYGISASVAQNCRGESGASGFGIYADMATGCYGYCLNVSGIGIHAANASYCVGNNQGGGVALQSTIASGCINTSGTTSATYKYNMP
jgi:hypothetical protein